jgi:type IV secretory pathway TrbF-like protein
MSVPKKGDEILCFACKRGRLVIGLETQWKYATAKCQQCPWTFQSDTAGKKRLFAMAHRHADARGHLVHVEGDGVVTKVPAKVGYQPPLIDDLLLPD